MMNLIHSGAVVAVLIVAIEVGVFAQTPAPGSSGGAAFDVVSIKRNPSGSTERSVNVTPTGVTLAVTLGREVGIDIECHREVEVLALGSLVFSEAERGELERAAPDERLAAFFRGWTRRNRLSRRVAMDCDSHWLRST